jgi:hypothetical protein
VTSELPGPAGSTDDAGVAAYGSQAATGSGTDGTHNDDTAHAKDGVPVKRTAVAKKTTPAPIVRKDLPPVNRLDAQDRQDTRATYDDATLDRYKEWDWHKLRLRLATIAGIAAVFMVGVFAALLLIPDATIRQAIWIAGAAVTAGSGGLAVMQFGLGRRPQAGPPDHPAQ